MKYFLISIIASIAISFAQAQPKAQTVDPKVSAKQAKTLLKEEQKDKLRKRTRAERVKKEEENRTATSVQYKEVTHIKTPLFSKRKTKKAIQPSSTAENTAEKRRERSFQEAH